MTPWLLVAGDLTPLGGMDAANHALARYLGEQGSEVHLVTHRAWPDLAVLPDVTVHRVWRPFDRHLLGSPLLSRAGLRLWRRLGARGARAVVNGGNCRVAGANWVHYLHAAYAPAANGSASRHVKAALSRRRDLGAERRALGDARVVICNSRRTRRDVIDRIGIPADRVEVVYYGSDPVRFAPVGEAERTRAKKQLGHRSDRPLVGFIGALGDRRKAFDTVFEAWRVLCQTEGWDADLVVVGSGAELPRWRRRADQAGLAGRIRFLGFRTDVPDILAALDALVHPARYEAYGLSVHEALCRGVAALVTASAGVAEHYPDALADLLVQNPDDPGELAERLRLWRRSLERFRVAVSPVSEQLRSRTWDMMAQEIVAVVERRTQNLAAGRAVERTED
jgi:glycosyltransferase involved in cell wall biosynthesis